MVGFEYSTFLHPLALLYTYRSVVSSARTQLRAVTLAPNSVQKIWILEKNATKLTHFFKKVFHNF